MDLLYVLSKVEFYNRSVVYGPPNLNNRNSFFNNQSELVLDCFYV